MAKGACFLFLGPEIGLKQDAVKELRRELSRGGAASLEESSFYAGETPVQNIVSILRNGSLFADMRLFFIKNTEALKVKDDVELLASYMAAPQENTTLILMSEAYSVSKGLEKNIPSQGRRVFGELFENKKTEWVESFFRREGYRISGEGIETVLEMVENNTEALGRECSRLMLFMDKDQVITGAAVEKWLSHSREESAFTLFSRIAEGNLSKSLESLRTLLAAKESPQSILAGLVWCFRKLRDYRELAALNPTDGWEFKKIGLASPKSRRDYAAAARRYPSSEPCLSLIAEYDALIRAAGSGPEILLMDLLVYKLVIGGRVC
jgi:DNA polymerase-3 subunit delta